jgi:hypothetical protein
MRDVLWLSIDVGDLSRCQMLSDLYLVLSLSSSCISCVEYVESPPPQPFHFVEIMEQVIVLALDLKSTAHYDSEIRPELQKYQVRRDRGGMVHTVTSELPDVSHTFN